MAYRVLEVTLLSTKDLKRVNLISRMEVYAVVTISGDPLTRQCTQPDPYGGRHPSWNTSLRFNVPPSAATATGCLHVLLRTERALDDRDVGEVIVPLADILASGGAACDPGARPERCTATRAAQDAQRVNVSYRLGPIVAPQAPPETTATGCSSATRCRGLAAIFLRPALCYLPAAATLSLLPPPHPQAAAGHDAVHPSPQSAGATSTYNLPAAYPQVATAGHASSLPPPTTRGNDSGGGGKQLDFGWGWAPDWCAARSAGFGGRRDDV